MQQEGISLDKYNFVHLINACVSLRSLEEGKCVHAQIIENGYKFNMFVGVAC
jgi:pentatricopeptide repeat protein